MEQKKNTKRDLILIKCLTMRFLQYYTIRTNRSHLYHYDYKRIIIVEVKHGVLLAKILHVASVCKVSLKYYICSPFPFLLEIHSIFIKCQDHKSQNTRVYSHTCFTLEQLHCVHSTPASRNLKHAHISSLRGLRYYLQSVLKSLTDKFWGKCSRISYIYLRTRLVHWSSCRLALWCFQEETNN